MRAALAEGLFARGEDAVREGRKLAAAIIAAFHEPFEACGRPVFGTPSSTALIAAILAMAGALRVDVVAEGVESYAQLQAGSDGFRPAAFPPS